MHDLVEWVAEQPPHLRAIFPVAASADLYEAMYHNGLYSATFTTGWLSGVANLAGKRDGAFRNPLVDAASRDAGWRAGAQRGALLLATAAPGQWRGAAAGRVRQGASLGTGWWPSLCTSGRPRSNRRRARSRFRSADSSAGS
jgi:hypothetical protein